MIDLEILQSFLWPKVKKEYENRETKKFDTILRIYKKICIENLSKVNGGFLRDKRMKNTDCTLHPTTVPH